MITLVCLRSWVFRLHSPREGFGGGFWFGHFVRGYVLQANGAPAAHGQIIVVHIACRALGADALWQQVGRHEVEARGANGFAQRSILLPIVEGHDVCLQ